MVERRGHPREIVEALVDAGADREYFADKDEARRLGADARRRERERCTVRRDEEHNRYLLRGRRSLERLSAAAHDRRRLRDGRSNTARCWPIGATSRRSTRRHRRRRRRAGCRRPTRPADARKRRAAGATAAEGESRRRTSSLKSLDELVDYFLAAGKKGVAINRYKGLGEMNPEQLWETTMDPTVRTLLQVRAEDHTEADLMFTTLMGDQVEPRRKFIEDNALDVQEPGRMRPRPLSCPQPISLHR